MINIIAAYADNNLMGAEDGITGAPRLPWEFMEEDMKRFRKITSGHPVIMGRKTFESIGRPLPKRENIIVTRNKETLLDLETKYIKEDVKVMDDVNAAIEYARDKDPFIIGGGDIYKQTIAKADRMHITRIFGDFHGNVHFPEFEDDKAWEIIKNERYFDGGVLCAYRVYRRKPKPRLYVDMDDTIAAFTKAARKYSQEDRDRKFPQSRKGFFLELEPMEGAIEAIIELEKYFDVWFLTRPSFYNTHCYTEKAEWILKHLGFEMQKKLVLCGDKSLLKGDILIDDVDKDGQLDFEGTFIKFGTDEYPNWAVLTDILIKRHQY